MTDVAIYELMTSIKDSWHHFRTDDIKGSLKSVAGRVFSVIKQHSNPDLDVDAMIEETWLDQSYLGGEPYPDQDDIDNFNEYVKNWKYPRKEMNNEV